VEDFKWVPGQSCRMTRHYTSLADPEDQIKRAGGVELRLVRVFLPRNAKNNTNGRRRMPTYISGMADFSGH